MKRRIKKNVMPEQMEMYWIIPSFIDKNGIERSFSSYYVHKITGDIWSTKSERYLRPTLSKKTGYMQTGMMDDNGKSYTTQQQRIVSAAKLQYWLELKDVHHLNRLRWDNRPDNLEPRTRKENIDEEARRRQSIAKTGSAHPRAKFTEDDVYVIKVGAKSASDIVEYKWIIADKYGVHTSTIHNMLKGKTWDHVQVV